RVDRGERRGGVLEIAGAIEGDATANRIGVRLCRGVELPGAEQTVAPAIGPRPEIRSADRAKHERGAGEADGRCQQNHRAPLRHGGFRVDWTIPPRRNQRSDTSASGGTSQYPKSFQRSPPARSDAAENRVLRASCRTSASSGVSPTSGAPSDLAA